MAVTARVYSSLATPSGHTKKQKAIALAACAIASKPAIASDTRALEKLSEQKQYVTLLQTVDAELTKNKDSLFYVKYKIQALNGLLHWQNVIDTAKAYGYLCKTNEDKASLSRSAGNAEMNMHRYCEAEKDFDSCIKLDPKNRDRDLLCKGEAQLRQCKRVEAERTFLSADRTKLSVQELNNRHQFLLILGKNAEALKDVEICLRLTTNSPFYQIARAYVLVRMNDRKRALALAKHLVDTTDSTSRIHRAAFALIREIEAISGNNIKSITRLDVLDPHYREIVELAHRSEYALLEGRKKEGLGLLSEAIKIQPWSGCTIVRRANAFLGEVMLKEALADANLAVQREADNPEAYATRARVYVQMNRLNEALENWVTATNLAPIGENFYECAKFCVQLNRPDEALKYIDRAISLLPRRPKFYLIKGEAFAEKKDWKAAVAIYSQLLKSKEIEREPVVQRDTFSARAKAYRQLGKTALAEADEKQVNLEHSYLFDNAPFRANDDTTDSAGQKVAPLPAKKMK